MRLKNLIMSIPGRINLTSDLWTSIATNGYLCLIARLLDKNWFLQKRLLNFCFMPPQHTGITLCEKIYTLLCEWAIDKIVVSYDLDNASAHNVFVDLLKKANLL